MVLYFYVDAEMISCFNESTEIGNFDEFLTKYNTSLMELGDQLKYVFFPASTACKHYCTYFNQFLKCFPVRNRQRLLSERDVGFENEKVVFLFQSDFRHAIDMKNWNNFYFKYRDIADLVITKARKQGKVDVQIVSNNGKVFPNFKERDIHSSKEEYKQKHMNSPISQSKNQGTMLKNRPPRLVRTHQSDLANIDTSHSRNPAETKNENTSSRTNSATSSRKDYLNTSIPSANVTCTEKYRSSEFGSAKSSVPRVTCNSTKLETAQATHENIVLDPKKCTQNTLRSDSYQDTEKKIILPRNTSNSHHEICNDVQSYPGKHYDKNTSSNFVFNFEIDEHPVPITPTSPKQNYEKTYKDGDSNQTGGICEIEHSENVVESFEVLENNKKTEYFFNVINELRCDLQPEDVPCYRSRSKEHITNGMADFKNDMYSLKRETEERVEDVEKSEQQIRINGKGRLSSIQHDTEEIDDSTFKKKLQEQSERNKIELEKKKQERMNKKRKFEDEIRKLKNELIERFNMIMSCIALKRKFDIQEDYWKDWIHGCRQNISKLLNHCHQFVYDVNSHSYGLRESKNVDFNELELEITNLLGFTMMTYNAMEDSFAKLKELERMFPDASFVRVFQKCIADTAKIILEIYDSFGVLSLNPNESNYQILQDKLQFLQPSTIHSTSDLHRICNEHEFSPVYQNIEFPSISNSSPVYVSEISE
ncbi:ULP_PROTEASE domain-containing protein [Caenorhabditis elegans]|uniref:ULP_PROTEASE domain-containing protein n=1 Tax=Caenorhabditis elegans TaxID=6239 RepID=E3W720_CAEEL|nr:ULP_PROTEASE domain-containing protein [Caenorhabditis elegans]CCD62079.2 ULP_PROTEASE domain-containing protein [Caenorhabditis elegans]|eukprot:NP_001343610.1 Uncharacterized protein CELE_B0507.6 [Caenorhabditis elegans]